jgi:hypothetical protein
MRDDEHVQACVPNDRLSNRRLAHSRRQTLGLRPAYGRQFHSDVAGGIDLQR